MSPFQSVQEGLRSLPTPIAAAVTLASAMVSWVSTFAARAPMLAQVEPAAAVSAFGAAAFSAAGVVLVVWRMIDNYRIERAKKLRADEIDALKERQAVELELKRQAEEAYRGTLTHQIDELKALVGENNESLTRARESVHAARNESAARDLRHQAEIHRLNKMVELLGAENHRLHEAAARVEVRTKRMASRLNTPDPDSEVIDPGMDAEPTVEGNEGV